MAAETILERNPEVTSEVVKLLTLCKKCQLTGHKDADLRDKEFIAMYVASAVSEGARPGFIGKSIPKLIAHEEFWPKPCTVVKYMLDQKAEHERVFGKIENPVALTDGEGNSWVVSKSALDSGWTPPSGIQTPALPAPGVNQKQRFLNAWNKLTGKLGLTERSDGSQ